MLKVTSKTTVNVTPSSPSWHLFVTKSPANSLSVSGGACREVLTTKCSGERVVVGSGGSRNLVKVVGQLGTTVLANQPATVYKTIGGEVLSRTAIGQVIKGQIVFIAPGGTCRVASASDPEALFLPMKIAAHSAGDGETVRLLDIDGEHTVSGGLVAGEPVFLGLAGAVSAAGDDGVVSVALGVATATNKFFGRVGQRVKLSF